MKKAVAPSLGLLLLAVVTLTVVKAARTGPAAEDPPVAVPGSELHHNEATPKPGYEFIDRTNSVDVVNVHTNKIMGTYVCPCSSADKSRRCELVFQSHYLTCKRGSCADGSCLLTAALRTMRQ